MRSVILKRDLHIDLISTIDDNTTNNNNSDGSKQTDNLEGSSMKSSSLSSSSLSSSSPSAVTTTTNSSTTITSSIVNDLDSINVSDIQIFTFDHSRCSDCSYGYIKACDCMSLLNALGRL